ncbi:hypothetical protein BV898_04520 [Hypsibius exemplaris]|uniref:DDE-1 domain-containing protein n=1 Tax=Hypsibius exemplaris TaxID=2072580 RepID=A0A1W0X2L7_HYPEX|nr:hypothetical protein BV898_04520 [Hypsibius exemplaris]
MSKDVFLNKLYGNCLLPNVCSNSIVLLDSFPAHKDADSMKAITQQEYKHPKIRVFSPGTTGLIQPCDVFYFQPYKIFLRKVTDRILLDDPEIQVFQRNIVIRLQTLVHHQF